jgi:hypothetical protein
MALRIGIHGAGGLLLLASIGCAASGDTTTSGDTSGTTTGAGATSGGAGGAATSSGIGGSIGTSTSTGTGGGAPAEGEVYGHSDTTLFKLEPISKQVTIVGNFDCVSISLPNLGEGMWDIAIDKDGAMVGTMTLLQGSSLVSIDKATAHCSVIAQGSYPNSLTFVPVGILDPAKEILVGYNVTQYMRIDPTTGAQMPIGDLNPGPTAEEWESSGDVVSIIGDKTYLTVKPLGSGSGYNGPDTIVEVDPVDGHVVAIIGNTTYPKLWGLGYWGGTAYGFGATGQLCAIDLTNGSATGIPLMDVPANLAFWGAGVTTSAPIEPPQ